MNTTDEIMTLVSTYADAASEAVYEDLQLTSARRALITAIDALVEQAKWAHHIPALLTDADAAADLAGVARPGAEPAAGSLALNAALGYVERHTPHLVYAEIRKALAAPQPAQASQPEARPGAEPIMRLTGYQLCEALEFLAPDGESDLLEQEVCIQHGPERTHDEGTDPAGLYCWLADYPEEGSIPLTGDARTTKAPTPQASQPLTDKQIEQCIKQAHSTVQGRNLEHAFARAIEAAHGIGAAQKGKP